MMSSAMRQLEERHMASKVDLMVWSHKMDLLALSNIKGEVSLHRLSWQRVWTLAAPVEDGQRGDLTVKAIAWRPDGQVISLGYSNNLVLLVDVENKDIIHTLDYRKDVSGSHQISCMAWLEDKGAATRSTKNNLIQENAKNFLPRLPPISRSFGSINEESNEVLEDTKKMSSQKELNFLVVGFTSGSLYMSVFGLLDIACLVFSSDIRLESCPLAVEISTDLKNIYVVASTSDSLVLVTLDTSILNTYSKELYALAFKHGQIMSLMDYLDNTMTAIREAYENMLLLDMESKLTQYAQTMPEGSVSADFLELLMFGTMSDPLESFLLHDLTDKGIKKLSHSIELSHSNIQKLILKHVQAVSQNLAYHLSDLKGMARYTERLQVLGITETLVAKCFTEVGSFLVKANEVLLVIDESMKKYKALLKWLYDVISRISEDRMPDSALPGVSEQDTKFIADYLYNLEASTVKEKKRPCFLDHLGQYLSDSELVNPISSKNNPWESFLKENPCIANNPAIIPRNEKMSLMQQHNLLTTTLKTSFCSPQKSLTEKIEEGSYTELMQVSEPRASSTSMILVEDKNKLMICCIPGVGGTSFGYIEVSIPDGKIVQTDIFFKSRDAALGYTVLDLQIYNKDTISVLLKEPGESRSSVFLQLPVRKIQEHLCHNENAIDGITLVESAALRTIESMVAHRLAVSGSRRVAVLLSENMHKVRTYEMEVEEDEEEEDMETTRESDNSSIQ